MQSCENIWPICQPNIEFENFLKEKGTDREKNRSMKIRSKSPTPPLGQPKGLQNITDANNDTGSPQLKTIHLLTP